MLKINKTTILIFSLIGVALLLAFVAFSEKKSPQKPPSIDQQIQEKLIVPKDITQAPSLPPEKGLGIDTKSDPIKDSVAEIEKLIPTLPLKEGVNLSTGLTVLVVIPDTSFQSNNWTLAVNISDLNLLADPKDPDYQKMRNSFRETAAYVFEWIRSKGADPTKIYFKWGDKAIIQERAEQWLKE